MVVLTGPIDWSLISRLSKDYDVYEEFGRVVVRLYPRRIRQPGSELQQYTWWHFRSGQLWWKQLPLHDRLAWKRLCVGSTWRSRDYYMHLALKVLGNAGYSWVQMAQPYTYFFPGIVRIVIFAHPHRTPKLRYRLDIQPGRGSPVTWSPVGHKIRNKRVLRTWQLSDGLNLESRFPHAGPVPQWWFDIPVPPKWSRIWFRSEWDYLIGPPIFGGWTGLYIIDNPTP